jgi:ferrochelatase
MKKTAIILSNLGGPDSPEAVEPFLFSLFYDRAIITLPNPLRWFIAKLISRRRAPVAKTIYDHIGGKSPILEFTREQQAALEQALADEGNAHIKLFTVMRHWKPLSSEVIHEVKAYAPDEIVFIPLYPQFSTTTTGSAVTDWIKQLTKQQVDAPCKVLCCYPLEASFIKSHAELIRCHYQQALQQKKTRILFSAHGLPKKIVEKGDPYQWQVEQTVAAIVKELAIEDLDFRICYQSRVGPMEWLTPSTDTEIMQAGAEKLPVLVVPVTFVSEHSETLVELDIEYKKLAEEHGASGYYRVPALAINHYFIESLATMCRAMMASPCTGKVQIAACGEKKLCPNQFSGCIHNTHNDPYKEAS